MPIEPVAHRRVSRSIIDQLVRMLASGELSPGDKLPSERDLAERFRLSRPSVREALRMMEIMGLIETRPGGGSYATDLNLVPFLNILSPLFLRNQDYEKELLEFRIVLELRAVESAARNLAALRAASAPAAAGGVAGTAAPTEAPRSGKAPVAAEVYATDTTANGSAGLTDAMAGGDGRPGGEEGRGKNGAVSGDPETPDASVARGEAIAAALRRMRSALEADDADAGAEADFAFHRELFALAENSIIAKTADLLSTVLEFSVRSSRRRILERVDDMEKLYSQHEEIWCALAAGDSRGAVDAMRRHLSYALGFHYV